MQICIRADFKFSKFVWEDFSTIILEGFRSLGLKLDYKFWFSGGIKVPWHADCLPVLADD